MLSCTMLLSCNLTQLFTHVKFVFCNKVIYNNKFLFKIKKFNLKIIAENKKLLKNINSLACPDNLDSIKLTSFK